MLLTLAAAPAPSQPGELSMRILPWLEEGAPDWLAGLADQILTKIPRLVPVPVLPATPTRTIRKKGEAPSPLVVMRDELFVIVPFGMALDHRLSGEGASPFFLIVLVVVVGNTWTGTNQKKRRS